MYLLNWYVLYWYKNINSDATGACPQGVDVTPEWLAQCQTETAEAEGGCWERERTLTWVPAWNQGGLRVRWCVSLVPNTPTRTPCQASPRLAHAVRCFSFQVERCVYAVQEQQVLTLLPLLVQNTTCFTGTKLLILKMSAAPMPVQEQQVRLSLLKYLLY